MTVAYRDVGHAGRPVLPHTLDQVVHQHLELGVGHPTRRGGGRGPRPAAAGASRQRRDREHSDQDDSRSGSPTACTHSHDASLRTAAFPRSPDPTLAATARPHITTRWWVPIPLSWDPVSRARLGGALGPRPLQQLIGGAAPSLSLWAITIVESTSSTTTPAPTSRPAAGRRWATEQFPRPYANLRLRLGAATTDLPGGSYIGPDGPGERRGYPKLVRAGRACDRSCGRSSGRADRRVPRHRV